MSQHVMSFPWKDLKFFPIGMSQHFIYDPYLSMACHGISRVVTACHGISYDKEGFYPKKQLLQVILLGLSTMHVLTRSCKTVVLSRSSKSILQDLSSTCKTHHIQDRARGSLKYLQD
jgi:hypothetical protein